MAFVSADTTISSKEGSIYQNNQFLFSVRDIFTLPNLQFHFINQTGSSLQFAVIKNNTTLGILSLRWKSRVPDFDGLQTGSYSTQFLISGLDSKLNWSQTSSHDMPSMIAYSRGETLEYLG
jgi:hypothetical protein